MFGDAVRLENKDFRTAPYSRQYHPSVLEKPLIRYFSASIDAENETFIQTALSRLINGRTVLVIAHRMRTVEGADKIVVLDGGLAAEQGTPKGLIEQNGIYARMVRLQTESQGWTLN